MMFHPIFSLFLQVHKAWEGVAENVLQPFNKHTDNKNELDYIDCCRAV